MQAAKLDKVIAIRRATTTIDDAGVPASVWADLVTLRAELVQNTATETIGQSGATTTNETMFRTRFFDNITVADILSYDSADYNIKNVTVIGRRRSLEIRAERIGL